MMYQRPLLASFLALGLFAAGCGKPAAGPENDPGLPSPAKLEAAKGPTAPAGHVLRADVDHVLVQLGPSWIFRRVMREEVLKKDGKFLGWRLTGLPEEWSGVDLRPGDVVTKVNGLALETPDGAWDAWKSVAVRGEIEVSLMRDGTARKLTIPIDGAPSPATAQALEKPQGAARPSGPAAPRAGLQLGAGAGDGAEEETY